jgi:hypothetical protein
MLRAFVKESVLAPSALARTQRPGAARLLMQRVWHVEPSLGRLIKTL